MEEIKELFILIEKIFSNCDKDYIELKHFNIDIDFFEDYEKVRVVNSFLFNFSKIQDKIGAKLFRKALYEAKEIDNMNISMREVLSILEKLSILNIEDWEMLREIRNSISHDYPSNLDYIIENINLAVEYYPKLKEIFFNLKDFLKV